jgi:hypothetical protein
LPLNNNSAAFRSDASTGAEEIPVVFKLPERIEKRSAEAVKVLLFSPQPGPIGNEVGIFGCLTEL